MAYLVPNAPCGVERSSRNDTKISHPPFLMHRVELKDNIKDLPFRRVALEFLMHRVELKAINFADGGTSSICS